MSRVAWQRDSYARTVPTRKDLRAVPIEGLEGAADGVRRTAKQAGAGTGSARLRLLARLTGVTCRPASRRHATQRSL